MVSKVKKEKFQNYQEQNIKVTELYTALEEIYIAEPHKKMLESDIDNFLDNTFYSKINLNFKLQNNINTISIIWEDNEFSLTIEFFGNGYWKYELIKSKSLEDLEDVGKGKFKVNWEGEAYFSYYKDTPEIKRHLFLLDPETDKILQIKEHFEYDYEPVFYVDPTRKNLPNRVAFGWSEAYYDGSINGYCYVGGKLHYFNVEETCEYDQHRMYAIYEITHSETLQAYWNHFKWSQFAQKYKCIWNIYMFQYNFKKKLRDLLKVKPSQKKTETLKDKKVIGYFKF